MRKIQNLYVVDIVITTNEIKEIREYLIQYNIELNIKNNNEYVFIDENKNIHTEDFCGTIQDIINTSRNNNTYCTNSYNISFCHNSSYLKECVGCLHSSFLEDCKWCISCYNGSYLTNCIDMDGVENITNNDLIERLIKAMTS